MARIRTIELTITDIAKGMGAIELEHSSVPDCPRPIADGVVDIGSERWRFRKSKLKTYIRYAGSAGALIVGSAPKQSILAVYEADV